MKKIIAIVLMLCLMIPTCLAVEYYNANDLFIDAAVIAAGNTESKYIQTSHVENNYNYTGSDRFDIIIFDTDTDASMVITEYNPKNSKDSYCMMYFFESTNVAMDTIDFFFYMLLDETNIKCDKVHGTIDLSNNDYSYSTESYTISTTRKNLKSFEKYMKDTYSVSCTLSFIW